MLILEKWQTVIQSDSLNANEKQSIGLIAPGTQAWLIAIHSLIDGI